MKIFDVQEKNNKNRNEITHIMKGQGHFSDYQGRRSGTAAPMNDVIEAAEKTD